MLRRSCLITLMHIDYVRFIQMNIGNYLNVSGWSECMYEGSEFIYIKMYIMYLSLCNGEFNVMWFPVLKELRWLRWEQLGSWSGQWKRLLIICQRRGLVEFHGNVLRTCKISCIYMHICVGWEGGGGWKEDLACWILKILLQCWCI